LKAIFHTGTDRPMLHLRLFVCGVRQS